PDLLVRAAYAVAIGWTVVVIGSFTRYYLDPDGALAGGAAGLYSALALLPIILFGALGVHTYGLRTRFGRAILFATLGSLVWQSTHAIYGLAGSDGYGEAAQVGYLLAPLLWGLGLLLLLRAAGITLGHARSYLWMLAAIAV